ncbi:MAG TPA: hypothetical protein PLB36_00510 [Bacillota bacterium]|nr:hypothetical protein [Candidatus Fermentithermobacillaceae bacterium]HOB30104.1 hypothetical protein [Bacillota bacterium]HOK63994.1 hypothetical protein [Bacillota bacterium]HOL11349.1 hypothetical protein [Bacillota bacterium]HOQ02478.1 hypothetical protein [Bacillota bacterium]
MGCISGCLGIFLVVLGVALLMGKHISFISLIAALLISTVLVGLIRIVRFLWRFIFF